MVDDYPDTVDAMCTLFDILGCDTRGAPSGADALEQVAAFAPQIVVLDLLLPTMDGFEIARRMRAAGCKPYLVALSGAHRNRGSAFDAGFDDFLLKPTSASSLSVMLVRALRGTLAM